MEIRDLVSTLNVCLKTIESALELKAQTGRFKNALSSTDLDGILINCALAAKQANMDLQKLLSNK